MPLAFESVFVDLTAVSDPLSVVLPVVAAALHLSALALLASSSSMQCEMCDSARRPTQAAAAAAPPPTALSLLYDSKTVLGSDEYKAFDNSGELCPVSVHLHCVSSA